MSVPVHERRPIGRLSKMVDLLPAQYHETLSEMIHTAEFRALDTLEDQLLYLREHTKISFEHLHIFLEVKTTTLYRYHKAAVSARTAVAVPQQAPQRYAPTARSQSKASSAPYHGYARGSNSRTVHLPELSVNTLRNFVQGNATCRWLMENICPETGGITSKTATGS